MDLKLKDVADLLNVSETTVRRWVADSKIPHYRLHQQYRFSRSEIEDWMLSCKQDGEDFFESDLLQSGPLKERLGTHQFGLTRAIHKGGVFRDIPGDTKEEVICEAMKQIAEALHLDADVLTELLLGREHLMPTALSNGIGVPHTRDFLLQEAFDVVAVVFPKQPIEYGALDGKPVHTLFFLFACDDKRHLHLLAKIAHLCSTKKSLNILQGRPDKQDLLDYIKEWESSVRHSQKELVRP